MPHRLIRRQDPSQGHFLRAGRGRGAVRTALVLAALAGCRSLAAADRQPLLLQVPARTAPLYLAAPAPESATPAGPVQLVEVDRPALRVPAQLTPAVASDGRVDRRRLLLIATIPAARAAEGTRRFRVEPIDQSAAAPAGGAESGGFELQDESRQSLIVRQDGQSILAYNYGLITNEAVPADNHLRSRSSYVHPVWSLDGAVITDDFPKDHYHHHGVFWTWPYVRIGEQSYDLWAGPDIQDRFVRWLQRGAGPAAAVLGVENAWYVGPRKVMTERVWIRCYPRDEQQRAIDFEFVWMAADRPISLQGREQKSYGGFTMRFAPRQGRPVITVPSGPTTDDLVETPLAWADFTAQWNGAQRPSGAALLVHPSHLDFPPTWLTRHYGCLCIGWPGVHPRVFPPGEPVRARYRIWIHAGAVETAVLQSAYDSYASGEQVTWE